MKQKQKHPCEKWEPENCTLVKQIIYLKLLQTTIMINTQKSSSIPVTVIISGFGFLSVCWGTCWLVDLDLVLDSRHISQKEPGHSSLTLWTRCLSLWPLPLFTAGSMITVNHRVVMESRWSVLWSVKKAWMFMAYFHRSWVSDENFV